MLRVLILSHIIVITVNKVIKTSNIEYYILNFWKKWLKVLLNSTGFKLLTIIWVKKAEMSFTWSQKVWNVQKVLIPDTMDSTIKLFQKEHFSEVYM